MNIDLLLRYWWIALLLILIIFIATRNLIKFILTLLGFLVIAFILLKVADLMLGPTIRQLSGCYDVANQNHAKILMKIKEEKEDKMKLFCTEYKSILTNLTECYRTAEAESPISIGTVENLMKFVKPGDNEHLATFVKDHNDTCKKYPETLVQ